MNDLPVLIIFAGANGSGKTTAAKYLLPEQNIMEFVNADEIARGLSPLNPAGQALKAGRLFIERITELIAEGRNFAIETTLSAKNLIRHMQAARDAGYRIELNYIYTSDVEINLKRIQNRVKQGGHFVPDEDVRRRYWRSIRNLFHIYHNLCDKINIYDVSGSPEPIRVATYVRGLGTAITAAKMETWLEIKKAGGADE